MQADEPRGYQSYRVSGLPAGPFGETYAISSVLMGADGTHFVEYFVISRRHDPHLHAGAITFAENQVPEDVMEVDEAYIHEEARLHIQLFLDDALFRLSEKYGDYVLNRYNAELQKVSNMPLLALWMRGELRDEIQEILDRAQNPRLRLCLRMVTQRPVLRAVEMPPN